MYRELTQTEADQSQPRDQEKKQENEISASQEQDAKHFTNQSTLEDLLEERKPEPMLGEFGGMPPVDIMGDISGICMNQSNVFHDVSRDISNDMSRVMDLGAPLMSGTQQTRTVFDAGISPQVVQE